MLRYHAVGTKPFRHLLICGLLLLATLLRWSALEPLSTTMLHYDEAFTAVDALDLMHNFRLTPFLPGNFGRESGWAYALIPFLTSLGHGLFALRIAATMTGFLAVTAIYRLGRELFSSQSSEDVAIWAMGSMAVLYWHVHLSHMVLRVNLFILVGTLATAVLLRAYRRNKLWLWVTGGSCLGLFAYTYFSSVTWGFYLGLLLLGIVILDRHRRRGAWIALACALLVALPMLWYTVVNTNQVLDRPTTVLNLSTASISANVKAWGRALFQTGDTQVLFNLPGRPVLDPVLGLMAAAGVSALVLSRKWRVQGLLILGGVIFTLVPSLITNFAPHFLRGAGFIIPLCLVLGAGATVLSSRLKRFRWSFLSYAIPVAMLLVVGISTWRDFNLRWLNHPETFVSMEMHINQAVHLIREVTGLETNVYFSPFTPAHPVLLFRAQDLAPRPTGAFNSHECFIVPDATTSPGTVYVSLTKYEPSFATKLSQWADVTLLYEDRVESVLAPRYSVFYAEPRIVDPIEPLMQFGDHFKVQRLTSLPETASPGKNLTMTIGIRAIQVPDIAPSLFLHLYSIPVPYEGGSMWAQGDSQICVSYPAKLWKPDEMVIQSFHLKIPDAIPLGEYVIAMGIYPFPNGPRIPVVTPRENNWDYVALQKINVVVP